MPQYNSALWYTGNFRGCPQLGTYDCRDTLLARTAMRLIAVVFPVWPTRTIKVTRTQFVQRAILVNWRILPVFLLENWCIPPVFYLEIDIFYLCFYLEIDVFITLVDLRIYSFHICSDLKMNWFYTYFDHWKCKVNVKTPLKMCQSVVSVATFYRGLIIPLTFE